MKKRLRKKLHKGEFKEFGFCIEAKFRDPSTDFEIFSDSFIAMFEERELQCAASFDSDGIEAFVTSGCKSLNLNENHKDYVITWLNRQLQISHAVAGDLVDAWQ